MIRGAIERKRVTITLVVFLLLFGFVRYAELPKQESPDISAPYAMVYCVYPGANPEDIEKMVTKRIEDEVNALEGVEKVTSQSKNSVSVVIIKLKESVSDQGIDEIWAELRWRMTDLQAELPEFAMPVEVNTDLISTAGMLISISSSHYTYEEMEGYAERVKDALTAIDGVSRFEVTGKQEEELRILVDFKKMNRYNLSYDQLSKLLVASNLAIPSGVIEDDYGKINVSATGMYSELDEIANTIVYGSSESGAVVRLKDIAEVKFVPADSNYKVKDDGMPSLLLTGYFESGKNVITIGQNVDRTIEDLKEDLPDDLRFDTIVYQPDDVKSAVDQFMLNLFQGILLVIFVVLLGMGPRNAVIVSLAIPLSIAMTFLGMSGMGLKIHEISIASLIIALGMLVDNAIVVSDAIQLRIDSGGDRLSACVDGVKEVAIPILTSTMTTIAAYAPFLLLNNTAGKYMHALPLVVMMALIASYVIALLVTPTLAYLFFKPSHARYKKSRVRDFYGNLLEGAMAHRGRTLVSVGAVAVAIASLVLMLTMSVFPFKDTNLLYVDVYSEVDGDLARTEEVSDQTVEILKEFVEIGKVSQVIGDGFPKFTSTLSPPIRSSDYSQIVLRYDLESSTRFENQQDLVNAMQRELDRELVGGQAFVRQLQLAEPRVYTVMVKLTGEDLAQLTHSATEVQDLLAGIPGAIEVGNNAASRIYEYFLEVDTDRAAALGITKYDIQNEMNFALRGREVSVFREAGKETAIRLVSSMETLDDLMNLTIASQFTGEKVLLKQIAKAELKSEMPIIRHEGGKRTISVYANAANEYDPISIENRLEDEIDKREWKGIGFSYDGERESVNRYFGDLIPLGFLSLALVFLILLIQFNSFLQPAIIMATVPLSLVGSIFGLTAFRQPLSFTALLGMVSLMGIVVNNAIVLIDFINTERALGHDVQMACREAVAKRIRPILLSTTTTVIGLIPLALGGSSLFQPMSIALIFGLLVSTVLTLIVIPVVYSLTEERKQWRMNSRKSENL